MYRNECFEHSIYRSVLNSERSFDKCRDFLLHVESSITANEQFSTMFLSRTQLLILRTRFNYLPTLNNPNAHQTNNH